MPVRRPVCLGAARVGAFGALGVSGLCRLGVQADPAALLDALFELGGLLLAPGVVARWELQRLLGLDPGLQLAGALQLGVDLGAQQQGEVRDPQPQQEHDDAGESPVRLVVRPEVAHVEPEAGRGDDPGQDRHGGADAEPAEPRLPHVGREVVEHRDDDPDDDQDRRELGDVPDRDGGVAEADQVADPAGHRPGDHERDHHQRDEQQDRQGEGQEHGAQLPDRAALVDVVHAVHGAPEGVDVAGRRPQRAHEPDDEREPGRRRVDHLVDDGANLVQDLGRQDAGAQLEHPVDGVLALAEDAEQRDEREEAGEDREDRVVRECRGEVGALVPHELPHGGLGRVLPGRLPDLRDLVRLARIVRVRGRIGLFGAGPDLLAGAVHRGPIVRFVASGRDVTRVACGPYIVEPRGVPASGTDRAARAGVVARQQGPMRAAGPRVGGARRARGTVRGVAAGLMVGMAPVRTRVPGGHAGQPRPSVAVSGPHDEAPLQAPRPAASDRVPPLCSSLRRQWRQTSSLGPSAGGVAA